MTKNQTALIALCLVIVGWVLLFPTTQVASSSPLLGFTLTPSNTPEPPTVTNTPHVPGITPSVTPKIPTLPPPPTQPGVLIPVTGADNSVSTSGSMLVTAGLVVLALGMVCLGMSMRKK